MKLLLTLKFYLWCGCLHNIDEDGYLTAFKARLVARGDLQAEVEDTYAATLAIHNLCALVAIANYFGLELKQYGAPTAYLNAKLNRKLHARTPDGVEQYEFIPFVKVLRALYGLKESALLWFNTFKN